MKLANDSQICLAFDVPDDVEDVAKFVHGTLDATKDIVGAYKVNPAFYYRFGDTGRRMFDVITYHAHQAGVPVIFDAKYADVDHTNSKYAEFVFDDLNMDAVTLNPYLGMHSLRAFDRPDKTLFILAATSNSGADFLQAGPLDPQPYQRVVEETSYWSKHWDAELGVVAGATYPDRLEYAVHYDLSLPVLIPGIGAQGGQYTSYVNGIYVLGRSLMQHHDNFLTMRTELETALP